MAKGIVKERARRGHGSSHTIVMGSCPNVKGKSLLARLCDSSSMSFDLLQLSRFFAISAFFLNVRNSGLMHMVFHIFIPLLRAVKHDFPHPMIFENLGPAWAHHQ